MEMDLTSRIGPAVALDLQEITSNTTTVGNILDSLGFESLDLTIIAGAITDGDYVAKVEHGDESNLSDAADVDALDLIGSLPVFADSEDDTAKHVGYRGKKQFVRLSLVSTNVSSGAFFTGAGILGHSKSSPTQ